VTVPVNPPYISHDIASSLFFNLLFPFSTDLRWQNRDFFGRIYISVKRITMFLSGYIKHAEDDDKNAKDETAAGTNIKKVSLALI
jgi:hypothetical protein